MAGWRSRSRVELCSLSVVGRANADQILFRFTGWYYDNFRIINVGTSCVVFMVISVTLSIMTTSRYPSHPNPFSTYEQNVIEHIGGATILMSRFPVKLHARLLVSAADSSIVGVTMQGRPV